MMFELEHSISYNIACSPSEDSVAIQNAPSEDSDQTV